MLPLGVHCILHWLLLVTFSYEPRNSFTKKVKTSSHFWTPRLPDWVHSNRPCQSVSLLVCQSVRQSVYKYLEERSLVFSNFGPRVYPLGSIVIAHVSPLVRWSVSPSVSPSLSILETAHWFFLIFCMKLVHHKGTKVTEPDF